MTLNRRVIITPLGKDTVGNLEKTLQYAYSREENPMWGWKSKSLIDGEVTDHKKLIRMHKKITVGDALIFSNRGVSDYIGVIEDVLRDDAVAEKVGWNVSQDATYDLIVSFRLIIEHIADVRKLFGYTTIPQGASFVREEACVDFWNQYGDLVDGTSIESQREIIEENKIDYVYVMEHENPALKGVKIGHSVTPEIRAIDVGNPIAPVKVVHKINPVTGNGRQLEKRVHEYFTNLGKRIKNEWFDVTASEALDVINQQNDILKQITPSLWNKP